MKSQPGRVRTDEQILGEIRDISARLGRASLTGADIEANSEITQAQLYRRFGGVSAALKRAGVEHARLGRRYTEDDIFENLLRVWTHYGRPPTALEMDQSPSDVGQRPISVALEDGEKH
jgi:Homing endonuclease associated repeat